MPTLMSLAAEHYVLCAGETPSDVVKKLGLSLTQLQVFNLFRSFHCPFADLVEVDEFDIMDHSIVREITVSQPKGNASTGTTPYLVSGARCLRSNDAQIKGASLLESSRESGATAGIAHSMVSGELNNSMQNWFSWYGTADVSLNTDEHISPHMTATETVLQPVLSIDYYFEVIRDYAVANGLDSNRVKATATDANGNSVPGITIRFTAGHGATIQVQRVTGADGSVSVIHDQHAGRF